MKNASPLQIRRLQTLYSAAIARELGADGSRGARLAWASQSVGRKVQSFSDLTSAEANNLIDNLQTSIGQQSGVRVPGFRLRDRDRAQAAGTEGRRRYSRPITTLASAEDLRRIDDALARLGWSQSRFDTWLQSRSSPLRGKTTIVTLGDANKCWWALKNMLKREGKWVA